jgi:hypothetical protein
MLLHPIQSSEVFPIGSIAEAYAPPNENWLPLDGSILAQADYPILYSLMDNPHPLRFGRWQVQQAFEEGSYEGPFCIAYNGTNYVALTSNQAFYSTDGENWTEGTAAHTNYCYNVIWNGSIFLGIQKSSAIAVTSSDGVTWTQRTLNVSGTWYDVVWDGTYFYAVGYNSGTVIRSTDGITWSTVGTCKSDTYYAMGANADIVFALSSGGDLAYSEDSGVTWDYKIIPPTTCRNVSVIDSTFVSAGETGEIGFSTDGLVWEYQKCGVMEKNNYRSVNEYQFSPYRIREVDNMYFIVGWGTYNFAYSMDQGKVWEPINVLDDGEFYDIIYNSTTEKLILYGYQDTICIAEKDFYYDESTYFQLPSSEAIQDYAHITKLKKYIRVK